MTTRKFEIDKNVFDRDVLLRSGFVVSNQCYVSIEIAASENWEVSLKSKEESADPDMDRLEGEFRNALITEAYRDSLMKNSRSVKELVVAKALFAAEGAPAGIDQDNNVPGSIDDEFDFIDDELDNYLDDPLGIAVPWEEKHSKAATEKDD